MNKREQQTMMPNLSSSYLTTTQFVYCALIFSLSAMLSGLTLRYAWQRHWMLFAFFWTVMYFIGGVRFMPWRTPFRKAFSIGIFVGTAIPALEWYLWLLARHQ